MAKERLPGLHAEHAGFVVGHNFYSPAQFAESYIGVTPLEDERGVVGLRNTLDSVVQDILSERIDPADVPVLAHRVITSAHEGSRYNIGDVRSMVMKQYKTGKLIDQEAIDTTASRETMKRQVRASVKSRRHGFDRSHGPHHVSVYDALVTTAQEGIHVDFSGGTPHAQTHRKRGHHWSEGLKHEKQFLGNLRDRGITCYDDNIQLVDYACASVLTHLDQLHNVGLLGSRGDLPDDAFVFMPFDFSNRPDLAFEAIHMRYAPAKDIKASDSSLNRKGTLIDVDNHMMGKTGFVQPFMHDLYASEIASKSILPRSKRFDEYTWAIIQAWEDHFFSEGRSFGGYSYEFEGTPFQTPSIVFDMQEGEREVSMRILLDGHLGLPYLMYKNFNKDEFYGKWFLNDRDPAERINWPIERRDGQRHLYRHHEKRDWHTGKEASVMIVEPSDRILDSAAALSENGGRGMNRWHLRGRYIDNSKRIRNKNN